MPNGGSTEDTLTEAPETSAEEIDELEDEGKEARGRLAPEFIGLLDAVDTRVQNQLELVEVRTFESQGLRQRRVGRSPLEGIRDSTGGVELQTMEENAQRIVERNGTTSGAENEGNRNAAFNAKRWLALIGIGSILVGTALAVLFEELYRIRNQKSDADIPLDDNAKQKIRDMIQTWASYDDVTFWGNLASYVQNNPFTLADMVYFMQYVQQFFPMTTPFFWDKAQDKVDIVHMLMDIYQGSNNTLVPVLQLMPQLTYREVPLPRNVQGSCGELAFSTLAAASNP